MAVHQSPEVARQRARRGSCFFASQRGRLIAKKTVQSTNLDSGCEFFRLSQIASAWRFAVKSDLKGQRLGPALIETAVACAARQGCA